MSLVYLDTSHLSILARARSAGQSSFADFLVTWRDAHAELVFTRTHLVELRQHEDSGVRADRYDLLEDLLPIRSDLVTRDPVPERPVLIQAREVLRALDSKGVFRVQGDDSSFVTEWRRQHLEVLPEQWRSTADVDTARTFESSTFGKIVLFMQDAMRTAAQAEKRPVRTAYKRTRVRDLPDSPVSAADTKYALESLEHILSSEAELSVLFPHLPVPIARDLLDQHVGPLRQMIARASDVGVQRAYLEAMGIVDSHDKRYLDDVTFDLMFQHHVRSALELLQIPRELVAAISQRVTVEDCPGFWLAHAVELEIRKAESEPASSNAYDLDHVMYAPYVDVFFSDKRIAGHINAVRKRQDTISSISRLPPAVATAARVDAISQAVTNIGSA